MSLLVILPRAVKKAAEDAARKAAAEAAKEAAKEAAQEAAQEAAKKAAQKAARDARKAAKNATKAAKTTKTYDPVIPERAGCLCFVRRRTRACFETFLWSFVRMAQPCESVESTDPRKGEARDFAVEFNGTGNSILWHRQIDSEH